jgi:hypothetical protein
MRATGSGRRQEETEMDTIKPIEYRAVRCNCGHKSCSDWHVSVVADVHGVSFTREEAEEVAKLLNAMDAMAIERHNR